MSQDKTIFRVWIWLSTNCVRLDCGILFEFNLLTLPPSIGIGPNEVLLIHIDDVQGWSAPAGYKCRKDAPLYDLSEWPKCAFMVLARLLSDLVARESKLRVVFSGTDYLVADALFHATEVSFKH